MARAAGVSASTVSYVLSGKRPISAPTRLRVERSIRKLSYRPHAGARALASNQTNVLALMAPLRAGVNVSVIMQFVAGVVTSARTFDFDVLLLTQDDGAGLERVALPGVIATLRDRGRVVPDDVSVVAVCPLDVAVGQPLPLTSVDIPAHALGRGAVEMAMARIARDQPAETRLIAAVLTNRDSIAPPR